MFNKKEIKPIIISIILMTIILSLFNPIILFNSSGLLITLKNLLYSVIIIFTSIIGKKIIARKYDLEITHKMWHFKRYGIKKSKHLKTAFPIGAIFPLILSLISLGTMKCFTFLQFDATPTMMRNIRKSKKKTFYEITDWDLGVIAFTGLIIVLILSVISDYLTFSGLAKYSFYYALWNLIPLGQLDGTKILFGSGRFGDKKGNFFVPLYGISLILMILTGVIVLI